MLRRVRAAPPSGENQMCHPPTDVAACQPEDGSDTQARPASEDPEDDSGQRPRHRSRDQATSDSHSEQEYPEKTAEESSPKAGGSRVRRADCSDPARDERSDEHDTTPGGRFRVRQLIEDDTNRQCEYRADDRGLPCAGEGTTAERRPHVLLSFVFSTQYMFREITDLTAPFQH